MITLRSINGALVHFGLVLVVGASGARELMSVRAYQLRIMHEIIDPKGEGLRVCPWGCGGAFPVDFVTCPGCQKAVH